MKKSEYRSYDDLLLFLNAEIVAKALGMLPSSGYESLYEPGFPVLCVGRRMVVPKKHSSRGCNQTGGGRLKRNGYRDGFFLPNEVFQLRLTYGDLAVYSFLKRCTNRRTGQC